MISAHVDSMNVTYDFVTIFRLSNAFVRNINERNSHVTAPVSLICLPNVLSKLPASRSSEAFILGMRPADGPYQATRASETPSRVLRVSFS